MLDLSFTEGEEVSFSIVGAKYVLLLSHGMLLIFTHNSTIHLTGNYVFEDDEDEEDEDMDDEIDEET